MKEFCPGRGVPLFCAELFPPNTSNSFAGMKLFFMGLSGVAVAAQLMAQPLPTSSLTAEGFDTDRFGRIQALVQGHVEAGKYAGAVTLVARHGKVVDCQAYGYRDLEAKLPMEPNTIVRIYSSTKVITGVAALQLFEQGRFLLSDPITNWIPELANMKVCTGGTADNPTLEPARTNVTVRMLMNHTSGFSQNDDYAPQPVREIYERAKLWESASIEEFIDKASKLPLAAQPGKEFNYGISFNVLGLMIQRISGESFDDYCAKHIFRPLGMKDTGFDVPPQKRGRLAKIYEAGPDGRLREVKAAFGVGVEAGRGWLGGGGGAFSTIVDYARFAQMLLNGGQLDGVRILGRKTVEFAFANSLSHLPRITHQFSDCEGWGLVSAVRVDLAKGDELGTLGGFTWAGYATTDFLGDPKEQLLMLMFTQHVPYDKYLIIPRFHTAVYQALAD